MAAALRMQSFTVLGETLKHPAEHKEGSLFPRSAAVDVTGSPVLFFRIPETTLSELRKIPTPLSALAKLVRDAVCLSDPDRSYFPLFRLCAVKGGMETLKGGVVKGSSSPGFLFDPAETSVRIVLDHLPRALLDEKGLRIPAGESRKIELLHCVELLGTVEFLKKIEDPEQQIWALKTALQANYPAPQGHAWEARNLRVTAAEGEHALIVEGLPPKGGFLQLILTETST